MAEVKIPNSLPWRHKGVRDIRPLDGELLSMLLAYDPETGGLTWKERPVEMFPNLRIANSWNARFSGSTAMYNKDRHGYLYGHLFGRAVRAHRAIWAMAYGDTELYVDHVNGVRDDNRLCNLRAVSHSENLRNQRQSSLNTSGTTGVAWIKKSRKWGAYIRVDGRRQHIGYFEDKSTAIEARKLAEAEAGYHENHGKPRAALKAAGVEP